MMRALTETGVMTVYNKPPFVNEILDAIQPEGISLRSFTDLVKESRVYDLSTILTAMIREIDLTGLLPNLAGVYTDPQEVLEALVNLGHEQLLKIHPLDPDLKEEVFTALQGGRCTLRALLVLNERQREVIAHLSHVRQGSPMAQAFRQATEKALRDLYHHPDKLVSDMFSKVISYQDLSVLYRDEPHICYSPRIHNDSVAEVWQFFFMPRLERIHLPASFHRFTVAGILDQMTPHTFSRKYNDDQHFDPRTPTGFIGLLGKVGGALPRLLVAQAEKNELLRKRLALENEIADSMYGLFSR
jgi:hypothetical protein